MDLGDDLQMSLTALVNIILALLHLRLIWPIKDPRFFRYRSHDLRQDSELVSGNVKLLDRFAHDLLVETARVYIGSIPC